MYIHCFLPLLLVSVIKCYVFNCIVLCLVLFPCFTYMCLLQLPICTCLNSLPNACPPSSVLHWCLLCTVWYCKTIVLCPFFMFIILCTLNIVFVEYCNCSTVCLLIVSPLPMFWETFLISGVLATNLMLTGLLFVIGKSCFVFGYACFSV